MAHLFLELLKERIIVFDGAMGTELIKKGLKPGECPELWNINHPEAIEGIHKNYIEAGAEVIETNTFGANRIKLSHFGLSDKVDEINFNAVKIAKKASKGKVFVALSVGPTGILMEPYGPLTFEEAFDVFKEQISAALEAQPDIILIETMSQLAEARAAVLAAKELCNLPIIATMTFEETGKTLMGTDPTTALFVLSSVGADVVGVNCSLGPDKMASILYEMSKYECVPILVQPNAGIPKLINGETFYPLSPSEFAQNCTTLIDAGINAIGGCCGTTPEHIKSLKVKVQGRKPLGIKPFQKTTICSDRLTVFVSSKDPVKVIGERINPTGKKVLSEELKSGILNGVINEAISQKVAGADILDVNLGVPGIDEASLMKKAVLYLSQTVDIPLCIDSSNPEVIEEGLKVYPGKALLNSVNGSKESLEKILPIVKKYGAAVIGLTLDERGLPKNAEERLEIARKIVDVAVSHGISKNDVIIDCLCLTAGTEQEQALETINAIKKVKEELGCLTTLGVSNISYGLPGRNTINSVFLAMALGAGLDLPIVNPLNEKIWEIIRAADVLTGRDKKANFYISFAKKENKESKKIPSLTFNIETTDKSLYNSIVSGNDAKIEEYIKDLFLSGIDPFKIIDHIIIPALNEVGKKYEKGEYFIPELLLSAEAAKKAFELIKSHFLSEVKIAKGKIILATVKGDIHDLGKNIVKAIMENYGFDVIDLGIDVDPQVILKEIEKHPDLKLVGLSALMTTSIPSMQNTIKLIKNKFPSCKVVVGGAVLNKELAKNIGADFYAKDAIEGIKIAEEVYSRESGSFLK